jgi:hypothetical protein
VVEELTNPIPLFMETKSNSLEPLTEFMSIQPCRFCIVFHAKRGLWGPRLQWRGAVHCKTGTHETYDSLVKTFCRIARHCYRWNLTFLIDAKRRRNMRKGFRSIEGVRIYEAESETGAMSNARPAWWYLVVGSGETRLSGHVIVAKVEAIEPLEVCQRFLEPIQRIMALQAA